MMAGIYRCILLLIVGLFFSSLSYAKNTEIPSYEEGISLFDVEATLQPNGVLDIKENIHFQARNQQIKHGFYRDLPRLWMQPDGDAALLNYHIVGVTRDGIPEPWHLDWHIGLMSIVVAINNVSCLKATIIIKFIIRLKMLSCVRGILIC